MLQHIGLKATNGLLFGGGTGDSQGETVAEKNLSKTFTNHGTNPPTHQGLRSVLPA